MQLMSLVELIFIGLGFGAISLIATFVVRYFALKIGIVDHPKGGRKIHERPIALWGGLGIAVSIIAGALFFLPQTMPIFGRRPSSRSSS